MNPFFKRMFYSRPIDNKMNYLHKRYLCIVYSDKTSFGKLKNRQICTTTH